MPGFIVFDPDDDSIGLSTGTVVAVGSYLDVETDPLFYTNGFRIFEWDGGGTTSTYIWKSGKTRFPKLVNIGAGLIEADTYADLTFRLYADGVLKCERVVENGKPFRLPGGYLSNIYEVEVETTDVISGISIAENIFELAEG